MKNTRLTELLKIEKPIIQAGMVWVSGGKLAAASSNAGILGVIGAGSMAPELLREHINKAKLATQKPLAVNVPLLYSKIEEQMKVILDAHIPIVITSAGSPKRFTSMLLRENRTVLHVVSTPELAQKCEDAGVHAVIAEGFEAGGHNGRDELTTMVLIPQVVDAVKIPVVAAGGIMEGRSIAAAFCLGAEGVQMGTRFLATMESSAHPQFKQLMVNSAFNSTSLMMKKLVPVRLFKNDFYQAVKDLEERGGSVSELETLLGKGRAKLGMLEGNLQEGELEVGQGCSMIHDIPTVQELVLRLEKEYQASLISLKKRL